MENQSSEINRINKIFVYGTLLDNFLSGTFQNIDLPIKYIQNGQINARLFDLWEYPGVKPTVNPLKKVFGKMYELYQARCNHILNVLDDYEEYNTVEKEASLFVRKVTPVITADGGLSRAWVYWYNRRVYGKREIEKGDYKEYLSEIS